MTGRADRRLNAGLEGRYGRRQPDVVFKYLMQDQRVARLLIGRITGLAVQSLTVSPQETAVRRTPEDPEHDLPLTLLRMDFAARVQTRDGRERQVLIEIQKANAPTVIERFRRYLDQQIGSGDNILTHPSGRTEAVRIVTVRRRILRHELPCSPIRRLSVHHIPPAWDHPAFTSADVDIDSAPP